MSTPSATAPHTAIPTIDELKSALIDASFEAGALKFGSFVLKSGRISPYFFNAGPLSTGPALVPLSLAYAYTIHTCFPEFDVLFGPAYKGIPFAVITTLQLYTTYKQSVGYTFNRKEVKDHGEGGGLVGSDLRGKRVLILDDVMTSGLAVRESMDIIKREGGVLVGVVELLDREEVGRGEKESTVMELEREAGVSVRSVLKMRDLVVWLEAKGMGEEVKGMREYWVKYGVEKAAA